LAGGRKTLTTILCTLALQQQDWSAHYRLYSRKRVEMPPSFRLLMRDAVPLLPKKGAAVTALDDTIMRKRGKKIPGVGWLRDPLGPPFQTNLVRAQRLIQVSMSLSEPWGGASRMIPVWLKHAPAAKKPSKRAEPQEWQQYRKRQKEHNLSSYGVQCLQAVRESLDECGEWARAQWASVDGSYTNKRVLRNVPARTTVVGRIRSDAKLHYLPQEAQTGRGRNRLYGEQAPTPQQLRTDESIPWQRITLRCNGRTHKLRIKTLSPLRWRVAGGNALLRLVVIAPLGYRLTKHSKKRYRDPVYLICTDPTMSVADIVKTFLKRWDIEVNFRDEKTLIGMGQAQVRNEHAVEALPQMSVLSYAALLLAAAKTYGVGGVPSSEPAPKWYRKKQRNKLRASTNDLLLAFRQQMNNGDIDLTNLCDFVQTTHSDTKSQKREPAMQRAA
jgi:hypothetical protein